MDGNIEALTAQDWKVHGRSPLTLIQILLDIGCIVIADLRLHPTPFSKLNVILINLTIKYILPLLKSTI
jgi:hypothetical protein